MLSCNQAHITNLHSSEYETVFIGLVVGSNVVIVENFYLEHTVVGTGTQVGYSQNTGKLESRKKNPS